MSEKEKTLLEYFKGDELAANVWESKYAAEGEVSPDQMHRRMAKEFARVDKKYQESERQMALDGSMADLSKYGLAREDLTEESIYNLFKDFKYIVPQGSIMSTLGTDTIASLSNCFVIGSASDSYSGIFLADQEQAQLMKRRGGVGHDLSNLRPKGTAVNNSAKSSTGAVSFMHRFSNSCRETAQSGRRGALMLSMDVNHPDILDFIKVKRDGTSVTGANISVRLNREFMEAVENDEDYILRFPCDTKKEVEISELPYNELYDSGDGTYFKKIKAKEYWDELIYSARNHAEPGLMYWDSIMDNDPAGVYDEFRPISSNPCGEQFLQAYDSCRLMALNLFSFVDKPFTEDAKVNYKKLYEVSYEQQRLGDNLVELEIEHINKIIKKIESDEEPEEVKSTELNLWKNIKRTAKRGRRTGCGITALGDMLAALGVAYDSEEGLAIAEAVMKEKERGELDAGIDLAITRGPFKGWDRKKEYDEDGVHKNRYYGELAEKFPELVKKMNRYGRRSISWSTIAPTGSVSILTQTTSGCEPIFQPFYMRRKKINPSEEGVRVDFVDETGDSWQEFPVIHEKFKDFIMSKEGEDFDTSTLDQIELQKYFEHSPWYGSTANDIDWQKRNEMQAVLQKCTTNAISSCLVADNHLVSTSKGLVYLEDIGETSEKGFSEISSDFETINHNNESVRVDEFYNNGFAETIKITLKNGTVIQGTPNHKLRVLGDNYTHVWKELKDLDVKSDFIVGRKGLGVFGNSQLSLSKIIGKPFETDVKGGSTKDIKIPTRMSSKLARLLGYLISDGHVGVNGIGLCQTNNNVVEDFITLVEDLFGLEASIVPEKRSDSDVVNVVVNSRVLRDFMYYLGMDKKTCEKSIPKVILQGAGRIQTANFIKGLTLDGYVSTDKIGVMTTCSEKLSKELLVVLNQFGIEANIIKCNKGGTVRVFPNSDKECVTEDAWVVYCNKINSKLFYQYIGFAEDRKTEEFQSKFDSVVTKWTGGDIPDLGLRKKLKKYRNTFKSFRLNNFVQEMSRDYRIGDRISYDNLLFLRDLGLNVADNVLDETYMFLEVVSKEVVKEPLETFDLHIKNGNSYTVNNIVSHNTINLPSTVTEQEVSDIYMNGWKLGLKGQTVYVDGSRSGVLVTKDAKKEVHEFDSLDAVERPKIVDADVYTTVSLGKKYNVFVGLVNEKPYEVFITDHFTNKDRLQIRKNRGSKYDLLKEGELYKKNFTMIMSESEEAITRLSSLSMRHRVDIRHLVSQLKKTPSDNMFSFSRSLSRVLSKYVEDGQSAGVKCNDCGSENVIFEEGCHKCLDCGSSACG